MDGHIRGLDGAGGTRPRRWRLPGRQRHRRPGQWEPGGGEPGGGEPGGGEPGGGSPAVGARRWEPGGGSRALGARQREGWGKRRKKSSTVRMLPDDSMDGRVLLVAISRASLNLRHSRVNNIDISLSLPSPDR